LEKLLNEMSIRIEDCELLVGNATANALPARCYLSYMEMVHEELETLDSREKDSLNPCQKKIKDSP